MDSGLLGQNNFCFGAGGANNNAGGNQSNGGRGNSMYGQETGLGGFPSGGLLDNYLKQQQREELGVAENVVANSSRGAAMNAAFDAFMGGGGAGGGLAGGLGGLMGAAFGGAGGSAGVNIHTPGIVSSGLFNEPPATVSSNGGVSHTDFDLMDGDRVLLQRAMQGSAAFSKATSPAKDNTWIGNMSGVGDPYAENSILGPWSATSAALLGNMVATGQEKEKKIKKKSKNKPKRPLSAYNIFFKEERTRILEELPEGDPKPESTTSGGRKRKKRPHGKIGFESLAKAIGQRWQDLTSDQVEVYKKKAEQDMLRYKREMEKFVTSEQEDKLHQQQHQHNDEILGGGGFGGLVGAAMASNNDFGALLAGQQQQQQQQANKRQRFDVTSF